MSSFTAIKKEVLGMSPRERELMALVAWESIENEAALDPEGIELALHRDQEIESSQISPISHQEFLQRTQGK
jgi:hypothetical protein